MKQQPSRPRLRGRHLVLAAVTVVAGLALGGCGAGDDSGDGGSPASVAQQPQAVAPGGMAEEGSAAARDLSSDEKTAENSAGNSDGNGGGAADPKTAKATAPRVIRTAEVTVEVKNLRTSAARVRATAESLGGYVSSEVTGFRTGTGMTGDDVTGTDDGATPVRRSAAAGESVLVLRIPEPKLDQAVEGASAVGEELTRTSSSEDVTSQIADLDSRVKTQEASVARVRELLADAKSLKDIVLLESELTNREAELEALQARLASVSDRADLSTLTVVLRTPEAVPEVEEEENGFIEGLRSGWDAVMASTEVVLTILGFLLPIAVVVAIVVVPLVVVTRRRRRNRPSGPQAPRPAYQQPYAYPAQTYPTPTAPPAQPQASSPAPQPQATAQPQATTQPQATAPQAGQEEQPRA
ncbi:MAG: DUF4349 domain-containing protein [Actinomycetales bacterium]|nr:DUF4349 domain-containing protein [Actinomycetales bacterium]